MRLFQCPLCLRYHHFRGSWPAFEHGFNCPQSASGWYYCQRCHRFENFLTIQVSSQETSPGLSQAPQDIQTDLPDSLRSIGDQFPNTGYPPQLDLPDLSSSSTRTPGIIISTSSYESNQADATPITYVARGPPSDVAFGPAHIHATAAKSIKSESNLHTKANSTGVPHFLNQPAGAGSQSVPTGRASDLIVRLCGLVHTINKEWMAVLANEPDTVQHVSAYRIHSIFETGLRALQKCFGTRSPSTFEDLYCLAHLIMASACDFHKHETYDWDTLAESLLQWSRIIEEKEERALYQRVLWSTWRAQCISPIASGGQRRNTPLVCSRQLEPNWPKSHSLLLNKIRNGKAMRQGVEMLDSGSFNQQNR